MKGMDSYEITRISVFQTLTMFGALVWLYSTARARFDDFEKVSEKMEKQPEEAEEKIRGLKARSILRGGEEEEEKVEEENLGNWMP